MRELKAGGTFTFRYTLKNTHATKAAKNIKITLEQVEGVFSPTEGSNIFYIDQILAGRFTEFADVNGDGVVNVGDIADVIDKLLTGADE